MSSQVISSRLRQALPLLVFVLCAVQPFMDVASYFLINAGRSTAPMLVLRTAVLAVMTACGFALTRRKAAYFAVFALLGGFTVVHILACLRIGYGSPVEDLGNLLRIFLMPMTCLCFATYLEEEKAERTLPAALTTCLGIIAAVMVISTITGTDPHTYDSGNGISGWFYGGNCQSAILAMLVPIAMGWSLEKGHVPFGLVTAVGFGCLYALGTRLAYAALVAAGFCFFGGLLILDRKRYWKGACIALVCALLFTAAYPLSPMKAQQSRHGGIVAERQAFIDTLYAETLEQEGEQAAYDAVYREIAPELCDRFGVETIEDAYGHSLDYAVVSGVRQQKLLFGKLLMAESPALTHLFGLELGRFTHNGAVFDVENDFYGIYFLCGWVGLVLMLLYFGLFILAVLVWLLRDFRQRFTLPILCLGVAFCCGLAHAVFTAGVLRRNNASVYLGIVMAWAIHRMRQTSRKGEIAQ